MVYKYLYKRKALWVRGLFSLEGVAEKQGGKNH